MERYINIGIDICCVEQIQRRVQSGLFVINNFTDPEIIYCEQASNPLRAERYAARWAAKEAVIKSLKSSYVAVPFKDIFVLHEAAGAPFVFLEGRAKTRADSLGVTHIPISISHHEGYAIAACLAFNDRVTSLDVLQAFNQLQETLTTLKLP